METVRFAYGFTALILALMLFVAVWDIYQDISVHGLIYEQTTMIGDWVSTETVDNRIRASSVIFIAWLFIAFMKEIIDDVRAPQMVQ